MSDETKQMIDELLGESDAPETDESEVVEGGDEPQDAEEQEQAHEEIEDQEEGQTETETDESPDGEDSELSELEKLREQNEKLQQALNQTYQSVEQKASDAPKTDEVKPPDFFGEWQYEDIIEDEGKFKTFLNEFAEKIKTYTEESLYKKLPSTVSTLANQQISIQSSVRDFYESNPPLAKVKPFVATVTNQVASEHPDWDLQKVLHETAERAYKALGLEKSVMEKEAKKSKKPAFAPAGKTGSKRGKQTPDVSQLEKDIMELIDI